MNRRKIAGKILGGHRICVVAVLCLLGLCAAQSQKQQKRKSRAKTQQTQKDDRRVYLKHADVLRYDQYRNPDAQILNGNVAFSHQGATLYCDSAYFYEATNSFEAFSNVRMYQGDTLSLFSDYAYYDGNEQMVEVRFNVVLKHRQSTLYTDSLNYDRMYGVGYFFEGGKMVDKTSTLISDWGEYSTETKQAIFYYHVDLTDRNFHLVSDTLYYNTDISQAHTVGPSDIYSGESHIYTEDGYHNTDTEMSQLYGGSVLHNKGKTLIGDTVYHDNKRGTSECFSNVVYVDSVNKNKLTCDYCWYDGTTGYAEATRKAVAIDFSQDDSLYMHADTFKIYTYNIDTDSVYRIIHAYNRMRAYRTDVQAVCDSLVYNTQDSCMTMYKDPIVWTNNQQLLGEVIKVYMKDSTINRAHVIGQALSVEQMADSVHYNQVASKEMLAFFQKGELYETDANDNVLLVYYPIDESDSTLIGLNYTETSQLKMFLENRRMKRIWMPKAEGVLYPMTQIPPGKNFLPTFTWFDYIRPLNRDDIFNWRPKKAGTELKEIKRKEAPLQVLPSEPASPEQEPAPSVEAAPAGESEPSEEPGSPGVADSPVETESSGEPHLSEQQ